MGDNIAQWLEELGLDQYAEVFVENDVDFRALPHIDRDDLKELGVSLGHRKVILAAIAAMNQAPESEALDPHQNGTDDGKEVPSPLGRQQAERRQLTVMFCDLVGSTALSQRLDPEDLREIMRRYQDTVAGIVARFDGHIAKFLGDGVLAFFGWPRAYEDQTERAVRSGLAATAAVANLKSEVGQTLEARVGIATGQVVIGDIIGVSATEADAVAGETPNLAARLQGLARPGQVVIGASTRRLIGNTFDLEELGAHELKGFSEPVAAWHVLGESVAESRFEAAHKGALGALVGREHEMGLLHRAWEQSRAGIGQVILVNGEPGIGKSRLVDALAAELKTEGCARITFGCSPYHTNSALYPVIVHLERVLGWQPGDTAEGKLLKLEKLLQGLSLPLEEVMPPFASLLSLPLPKDRYPPLKITPEQQKQQTLDAIVAWLLEEAERQSALQVWEDLHWADPSTLELLALQIEQAPTAPILNVLTFRPDFAPPWQHRSHMTPLTLNRLERPEVEALIGQCTDGKALPEKVVEHIVTKTDGVPLYVEELTKAILEANFLREHAGGYELTGPFSGINIPATLQDSLMARLDRLPTIREVAQLAAVLGREFAYDMLQAIASLDEAELQQGLAQLVDVELLYQRGRPPRAKYTFKHALVQDAAYESLLIARRKTIHGNILAALETAYQANLNEVVELLAHHSLRAELWEKAVTYLCQAGAKAYAVSASREALTCYEQALGILEKLPERENKLEKAFDIRLGLRPVLNQLGEPRRMLERLREAENVADRMNDHRRHGQVCALLTIAHSQLGELDEALKFGKMGLGIAEQLEDLKLRILATSYLGLVHSYRGEYQAVIDLATENLSSIPEKWVYEFFGASAPASVYDRSWLIQSLAQIGKFGDAAGHETEALQIAEAMHHPFSIGQAHRAATTLHVLRGDWSRANSVNEHWIEVVRDGNVVIQLPWAISMSAWILAQLGQTDAALNRIRDGEELLARQVSRGLVVTSGWDYQALGRAQLLLGRVTDARRLSELALECSSTQPAYAAYGHHLLGDVVNHTENFDADFSETQYRKSLSLAENRGMRPLMAHCHFGLGKLLRRIGKYNEAKAPYATALEMYREMEMAFWQSTAEEDIATL